MIDRLYPGGTESQLIALIRHLDRERVQPFLCLLDGEDAVSQGMEPTDCTVLRLGVRSLHRPSSARKAWKFARFLRQQQIDVLQIYFPDSTYFGVPVAKLAGVPFILRTRNNINHWMTPTHRRLGRMINRLVTATITNCDASRQAVLADEAPPRSKVVVLENGVDLRPYSRFSVGTPAHSNGRRHVGVVANLRQVKGVDLLVEAAGLVIAGLPDVAFDVAGEGPARPEIEEQIRDLGLGDRFCLHGSVKNIPEFLSRLDVAVLCSRAEGMPNAVLEYMAAGRPIVSTAVGGATQIIEDGVHGLLVPPEDPAALANGITRMLEEPALAHRLATAARKRAEEKYSREAMVRNFESFYHRLLTEGKPYEN
jgi:glycosyltransferase involved in cell wall biosynthesis